MRKTCKYIVATIAALLLLPAAAQRATAAGEYVTVSERNPHYFALTSGETYIPIGCNVATVSNRDAITHYINTLADNGANYARVWLNSKSFEVETEYGKLNEKNLSNIVYLLDLASQRGIKVKLCIESFRRILPGRNKWDVKASYHTSNGGPFEDVEQYITSQQGRDEYLRRLAIIRDAVGDHPAVFGWELWNEMNAVDCKDIIEWNEYMLPRVKAMFPKNLVMQSLGSLDRSWSYPLYEKICRMPGNEVSQVHRYLDCGARDSVCHGPMDSLCYHAVQTLLAYGLDKPVIHAEGGAVEPDHTGPSKLYPLDTEGVLLHDVLFTPFFSGAAGPGHCWHWDHYIDKNNLWYHFKRFATAIEGIDPVAEKFVPVRCDADELKGYGLKGDNHMIIWYRDSRNDWKSEFVDGNKPEVKKGRELDLATIGGGRKIKEVSVYDPWKDTTYTLPATAPYVLPDFSRSVVVKITYGDMTSHQYAGQYLVYPYTFDPAPELTAAPEGYEPFHIEHYGRHGSRWLINRSDYEYPLKVLEKADRNGVLTPLGKETLGVVRTMADRSKKRVEELTDVGALEHQRIAERMVRNYPEVFATGSNVNAKSTTVIRCIISMVNELNSINKLASGVKVVSDASHADMYYMNFNDSVGKRIRSEANRKASEVYNKRYPQKGTYLKRLITSPEYIRDSISNSRLEKPLWQVMINTGNVLGMPWLVDRIYTPEEQYNAWNRANVYWFIETCNSKLTDNIAPYSQRKLLRNMIESADTAAVSAAPSANLRFGHDGMVMPLTMLMELNDYGREINSVEELEQAGWRINDIIPMAGNVQMIFYRPAGSVNPDDVLVKVLLNENEAKLPVETVTGPYYPWKAVREYYLNKLTAFGD